jgi:death-on-curing protein
LPAEPIWVTADEVEAIARQALTITPSEPFKVLDRGALESAVSRPLNAWAYEGEDDLIVLAVRLIEAIGQNHPFQQGNKRAAFFAALDFIEMNGGDCGGVDSDELGALVSAVITRDAEPITLVMALRKRVRI